MVHGLSCSTACGNFPDQGSNPSPLHWQADSELLHHQGSLALSLLKCNFLKCFLCVTWNITPDGMINFASTSKYDLMKLMHCIIVSLYLQFYLLQCSFSFLKSQPSVFISFLFRELFKSSFQGNFASNKFS